MANYKINVSKAPKVGPYNFVKEWLDYAEQGQENIFFSFFCQFLALNHLYESEELWHKEEVKGRRITKCRRGSCTREKLGSFLRHVMLDDDGERLSFRVSEDEFRLLFSVNQRTAPAEYWKNNSPDGTKSIVDDYADTDEERVKAIITLFKVYDVRNNLFHGEKHPREKDCRDVRLVKASNAVLKRFLTECAERGLGVYHWLGGDEEK